MPVSDEPRRIALPKAFLQAAKERGGDPLDADGLDSPEEGQEGSGGAGTPVPRAKRTSRRPHPSLGAQPGEDMYPCPCPCGCGNLTTMPLRMAEKRPVAARRLRCYDCSRSLDPKHAGHAPAAEDPATPAADYVTIRPLRPAVDPLDAELDKRAAEEMSALHKAEEWAKYIASVPEKFKHAYLDKQVDPGNAAAIRERLDLLKDGKPAGAILTGSLGGGKTFLGYSYVNLAVHEGLVKRGEVRHGTELELLGKAALADWSERAELLKALLHPRLRMLFIDDVGRDMHTRAEQRRALYDEIANWAWSQGRVLIITTNLKTGQPPAGNESDESYLAGWVGPAAYSRISTSVGDGAIVVADRQMRAKLHREAMQQRRAEKN